MLNMTIGVRMQKEDFELLKKICYARREDMSGFVRRAVRIELARLSYLTLDEKKALGLEGENNE